MIKLKSNAEKTLESASSYSQWCRAAQEYDEVNGLDAWQEEDQTHLYDYISIKSRLQKLRNYRDGGDDAGLLFALNEGIHGNMGGMGKDVLYQKAKSGTKNLINEYIDTICDSLLYLAGEEVDSISFDDKLDFFERASHCFGRSAMMFSGGGSLIYFHYGVAKVLIEQNLLPKVLSGASAGAMLVAILGTHSSEELKSVMRPNNLNFGKPWQPSTLQKLTGIRPIFDPKEIDESFERLIPDLTFEEAFELTGRHINISVSPIERHQTSRLLNAMTSPNVLIRSAVKASCAPPGVVDAVTLYAKDVNGKRVPYLPSRKWQDGSISDDLPAKRLSRLYGVNHYIVSLINPFALEYIKSPKIFNSVIRPVSAAGKEVVRQGLNTVDRVFKDHKFAGFARLAYSLLGQTYKGDINIVLSTKYISPFKIISPYTLEEVINLMHVGEKSTWPNVEQIRACSKIGATLDRILLDCRERARNVAASGKSKSIKAA